MSRLQSVFISHELFEEEKNVFTIRKQPTTTETLSAKRESRNRDSAQQSFLFAIALKLGFRISVNKLYKKGSTTCQMFAIDKIYKENVVVYDSTTLPIYSEKNAERRRRLVDCFSNDTLIHLLQETEKVKFWERKGRTFDANQNPLVHVGSSNGVVFDAGQNLKFTRISLVVFNDIEFHPHYILECGKTINKLLKDHMATRYEKVFELPNYLYDKVIFRDVDAPCSTVF
ncbi:Uncharacterized protein QTN25_008407 [Entamoeba marina]